MHTITLQVPDEVYPHLNYIINNLPNVKIIEDLVIESLNENDEDYKEIQKIKSQKNKKYSFDEAMKILGV
ncbi:hypothetical protein [Nautilia sp.]